MYDLNKTAPTPDDLATRTEFTGVLVPITRLMESLLEKGGQRSLAGYRFVDCVIRGPGVLIPGGTTTFNQCNMGETSGDVRNLFLRAAGPKIVGGISVEGATFEGCIFVGVGFAGDDAFVDNFSTMLTSGAAQG